MLVGALVIVLMSIFKSANPKNWAWLNPPEKKQQRPLTPAEEQRIKQLQETLTQQAVGQPDQVVREKKKREAVAKRAAPPVDQAQELRIPKDVFANINENALFIRHAEGEAYWTVFAKLKELPQADLERAALQDVTYTQLFSDPDFYRGRLITLDGELLQLNKLPHHDNPANIETVYEGWLRNADLGKNPYVFHCLDIPARLVPGSKLSEKVSITGYFFKRYQYPAQSGLPYAAPMLLAKRINWFPIIQRKTAADPRWVPLLLGGIATVGICLGGVICFFIMREQRRSNAQLKRFTAPTISDFGPMEPPVK